MMGISYFRNALYMYYKLLMPPSLHCKAKFSKSLLRRKTLKRQKIIRRRKTGYSGTRNYKQHSTSYHSYEWEKKLTTSRNATSTAMATSELIAMC